QFRGEGPQLAREELAGLMEAFRALAEGLGAYAGEHGGLKPAAEHGKILREHLSGWEAGTNTKPRTLRPPEGQRLIALSAPDGLVAATPRTAAVYAGESLELGAQQHGHVTVGQQLCMNAGKGLSLFAHSGGLKAIAHQDDLELQAQQADISLTARKNIKVFASENEILLSAAKRITLMAGGSYITVSAEGVVAGGPAFTGKVGNVSWPGPDQQNGNLPKVDVGKTRRKFRHIYEATGEPIQGSSHTIRTPDGTVIKGKTGQDGCTEPVEQNDLQILHLELEERKPDA
ncbi:MAG TPA: DUF2345 domain-containing protein, partial [Holophaga sp.]|nr:DUF2345 domain-containing protein [Holophaga sp.]